MLVRIIMPKKVLANPYPKGHPKNPRIHTFVKKPKPAPEPEPEPES